MTKMFEKATRDTNLKMAEIIDSGYDSHIIYDIIHDLTIQNELRKRLLKEFDLAEEEKKGIEYVRAHVTDLQAYNLANAIFKVEEKRVG